MKEEKRAANAIKVESKKVDTTVNTFLKGDSDGFQIPATKLEPEKVDATVTTFLKGQLVILTRRTASSGSFRVCQGSTH
jgi:hypothetical protein